MKIKCITNLAKMISPAILANYAFPNSSIPLIVDKQYIVYALSEYYQNTWYCICDESYTYHPMWIPQQFFQVVDNRISRYWVFSFKEDLDKNRFFFGFPEWATQLDFYDNLTDGEQQEVQIFKNYKELMDLEFPDSSITEVAQIGDDEWLICPSCIDAWQCTNVKDALVKCPKCQKILNNPRFKNEWPHLY
jgi:hypothetical protein